MKSNNQKHDNKGFSLVELIVVIAIMAVLVAVLAPQFTKYIDRSRQSNDATTVAGIVTAAQVGIADSLDYDDIKTGTYEIVVGVSGTDVKSSDAGDAAVADMKKAIEEACGETKELKRTASKWTEDITITVKYNSNGSVDVSYSKEFNDYINQ